MRNPIRLLGILLLFALPLSSHAQRILVVGAKRVASCDFATRPLMHDLRTAHYPVEWTIVVACNQVVWEQLRQKADALQTNTAFTNLKKRITVINGDIYRATLPLLGARRTPELVLQHEMGHILCGCDDEEAADHVAVPDRIRSPTSGRKP